MSIAVRETRADLHKKTARAWHRAAVCNDCRFPGSAAACTI